MTLRERMYYTSHLWRCRYCNRTADGQNKPGLHYGGKCLKSPRGMHAWVKER